MTHNNDIPTIIAHRGNLFGPDHRLENTLIAYRNALDMGFDVEMDVWDFYKGNAEMSGIWAFGHHRPSFSCTAPEFIETINEYRPKMWWHVQTTDGPILPRRPDFLVRHLNNERLNWFMHTNEWPFVRTNWNDRWCLLEINERGHNVVSQLQWRVSYDETRERTVIVTNQLPMDTVVPILMKWREEHPYTNATDDLCICTDYPVALREALHLQWNSL